MSICSAAHVWRTTTAPNMRQCDTCKTVQVRTPRGMWVEPCNPPPPHRARPVVAAPELWETERYTKGNTHE